MSDAKQMNVFERYLSIWVALCMIVGVIIGKSFPAPFTICSASNSAPVGKDGRRSGGDLLFRVRLSARAKPLHTLNID